MENTVSPIVVPTDFTKEAQCAINHAVAIAKSQNTGIVLVHVLNREFKNKMKKEDRSEEDVRKELESIATSITTEHGIPASYRLPEGSIFSAIGETAEELKASLMVMGTHGVVGLEQKILGAWALRVVADSPAPVVIVQNRNPLAEGYKKVFVTMDFNKEAKHLTFQAIAIVKNFGGEVILFQGNEKDPFISNQIQNNVVFSQQLCEANSVAFRVITQEGSDFHKDFVKAAVTENADMLCIMSRKDLDLKTVFLGDDEQWIINNDAQIPVMCVNPAQNYGFSNMVLRP